MDNLSLDRDPREMRVGKPQSITSIHTLAPTSYQTDPNAPPLPSLSTGARLNRSYAVSPSSEQMRYSWIQETVARISDVSYDDLHLDWPFREADDLEGQYDRRNPNRKSALSTTSSICSVEKPLPIPPKRQPRLIRSLRHTFLNVYRRLFSVVLLANIVGVVVELLKLRHLDSFRSLNTSHLATAASANIMLGTMIRQDYVINILFRTSWLVPHSAPMWFRKRIAKVYEFGGVHSSSCVCGTLWFLLLTVVNSLRYWAYVPKICAATMGVTYTLAGVLVVIIIMAYPGFRFKYHNWFEISHRFGGWTAIGLFWFQVIVSLDDTIDDHSLGAALVKGPAFWFLIVITFHAIWPWVFLRKWTFRAEKLSSHAVRLHFDRTLPPFVGIAISKSPLMEWHPFATFPTIPNEKSGEKSSGGGSLIVSIAGDWTRQTALDPKPQYWVRGFPRAGVLSMACIFRRVVIVTTGSGIGPCLGVMLDAARQRHVEVRVLWSAPSVLGIYGPEILKAVKDVDGQAVIIDTRTQGRPDMVRLAYNIYRESDAEAVFVISNPMLTRKVVYGMESRGIPAYGPIWDS